MGEAIISRATFVEDQLPMVPGYHTVMVALKDDTGLAMQNYPVLCNDGAISYTYKTNEKGKCIFMCNSGAANIYVNNYTENGHQILDLEEAGWFNIDAPVGLSTIVNINMNRGNDNYEILENKLFALFKSRDCDLYVVGAGGGGATEGTKWGSGGGAGYLNQYNNQILKGEYNFIVGSGGRAGSPGSGGAGGTSYIENTDYSAAGGGGGDGATEFEYVIHWGGAGGLGSGGAGWYKCTYRGSMSDAIGGDSPVDYAGGGGGGCGQKSGTPYGGSGIRAGGGKGGHWASSTGTTTAGRGGDGLMIINIHY